MTATRYTVLLTLAVAMTFIATTAAQAETVDEKLLEIENRWASATFETSGREKAAALAELLDVGRALASNHKDSPEAAAWHGIIARECIESRCGSRSSGLRREARDALLKAESLDPLALGGIIYANLGALYARTASPRGKGDGRARAFGYLWKAIVVDPNGLDSNYLYAEMLVEEKKFQEAKEVLQKASAYPARPDHLRADLGRREQILALLEKVETRL
jgi:tetratricopeptide (TPR) repeat protein